MTRDQLLLQVQQEYAARREENLQIYDQCVNEACERCEGLRELMAQRRAALMGGLRNALYPETRVEGANATLTGTLTAYNRRIAETLAACGLPADTLAPVYTCAICKDEGYVYEPSRKMCVCMEQEVNRRMLRELGLLPNQTFEAYRDDLFSDEPIVGKLSQRVQMRMNRDVCERYADQYPNSATRDLLLTGKSGLGKTFLMHAIAHRVTQRGHGIQYVSAYRLLETMRKAYFENNSELLEPLMEASLLLIDDLGTEPLMENITVTQLFNLLNERQNAGRHTVISTNLTLSELKTRYTERIASRLMDESNCKVVKFIGDDVRTRQGRTGAKGAEA